MKANSPILFAWLVTALLPIGCGGDDSSEQTAGLGSDGGTEPSYCVADESGPVPARTNPGVWQRVDIEGAICSNGSQYPIFVNYSETSNNVILMLEPGGACWDYASCAPGGGLRGAANPDGIPPGIEHMGLWQFLPLMRREADVNPVSDWNMVFIPYCTGDIHTGSNEITYIGPNGEELLFRHHGHENIMRVTEWLNATFTEVPKLLVTGCSAGGVGGLVNYHFFRSGMAGVQCGYLLDDAGPVFPSSGFSGPLYEKIRVSWNVDPIIDSLEGQLPGVTAADIKADFGLIPTALADAHEQDRLTLAVYRRDLNFSLYSYESFYDFPSYTEIHRMWDSDIDLLREAFDSRDNLGYFLPFFRLDNCSHCVTIPPLGLTNDNYANALSAPWLGSEIQASGLNVRDYLVHVLDDSQPLQSYFEADQEGEGFTPEEAAVCQDL